MSLATAAEYALLLAAGDPANPPTPPELSQLNPREQELGTLVAGGSTNAQIAIQLYISVRTVGSTWTGSGIRPAACAAPT